MRVLFSILTVTVMMFISFSFFVCTVFDFQQQIDALREEEKAKGIRLGTTKKGIGPTYSAKVTSDSINTYTHVHDFPSWDYLNKYIAWCIVKVMVHCIMFECTCYLLFYSVTELVSEYATCLQLKTSFVRGRPYSIITMFFFYHCLSSLV